jgi:hypothetical protein
LKWDEKECVPRLQCRDRIADLENGKKYRDRDQNQTQNEGHYETVTPLFAY